ncbi:eukaryotic translation initiation factor 2-alpha kinase [Neocloeon triangulifer]|uniref:eukaryotic translation initiation factor 2-alpha kinase n=1 Tax=Neocloeon triangulifer TaxID=2078957 RepID=UPI00286F7B4A|nr:eukaryotic translation initiation factor 2-alpha kinase [Neocloeon triangulifer]
MAGWIRVWASNLLFYLILTCVTTTCNYVDESQPKFEGLPFCSDAKHDDKKYVLISTLDGAISALNVDDGGSLSWSLPTGDSPMLSSSIHRLELTSNGQYVRMIPSLSGNLYKFDGKYIEPVPINANHLLRNSFRYSEDLVISGGRETMTYGLDMNSGRVIYECTIKGCDRNFTGQESDGHVLVVQRQTQTIRALEPRTGYERWNFSVAQHDVKLLNDPNSECHDKERIKDEDLIIKVIVPDGLVCALNKKNPSQVVWKHKFSSPVVHAWQYSQGEVSIVDMFSGTFTPPLRSLPTAPSLYVGMHEKQVYIQESVRVQQGVAEESIPLITNGMPTRIPWKPYPASVSAIGLIESSEVPLLTDESQYEETTALSQSVLYGSEYANGNGFFLFKPEEKVCDKNSTASEEEDELPKLSMEMEEDTPVQIVIVSLWYWWKEVLIICITTTLLSNFLCTQRYLLLRRRLDDYLIVETRSRQNSDSGVEFFRHSSNSSMEGEKTPEFSSRYLDDFEQIRCLGKGGFGVVFEAKKKIDDCHYAVKRIKLPNRKESQDRVMREVKALATLAHDNIVRYYHSWIECPPPGWQMEQDKYWLKGLESKDSLLPGELDFEYSQTSVTSGYKNGFNRNDSVFLKIPTDESSSIKGPAAPELSDSFIQFKESTSPSKDESHFSEDTDDTASFVKFKVDDLEITKNSGALQPYIPVGIPSSASSDSCEEENITISDDEESQKKLVAAPTFLYIQMQLCQKESLREWLHKRNIRAYPDEELHDFSHVKSIDFFHQITSAVEYIHNQNLIHRDLKPSNIFLSIDGRVKIGDFGLVTAMTEPENGRTPSDEMNPWPRSDDDDRHTANVGTRLYMSPEQVLGLPYGHKVDIFSLGLILYEMLVPFRTLMERAHSLQSARDGRFPDKFLNDFQHEYNLLRLMLSHCPEERPAAQEVRQKLPPPTVSLP